MPIATAELSTRRKGVTTFLSFPLQCLKVTHECGQVIEHIRLGRLRWRMFLCLAANRPLRCVLNAVDPKALTTAPIGLAINDILDHHPKTFAIPGSPGMGETPWSVPKPFITDMSLAARSLGYEPVMDYSEALNDTAGWIVSALYGRDWKEAFPTFLRAKGTESFNFGAEDAWVRRYRVS
jgi:hypothetical protein